MCSLAGMLGGGWLVGGPVGVGAALMFDSLAVGVLALLRDDGQPAGAAVHAAPTVGQVLERARNAS